VLDCCYVTAAGYTLLHKDNGIVTHVGVKRLQWARRIVRILDIRIPKRNLEVSEEKGLPEIDEWVGR
jgi:hypothetical protein